MSKMITPTLIQLASMTAGLASCWVWHMEDKDHGWTISKTLWLKVKEKFSNVQFNTAMQFCIFLLVELAMYHQRCEDHLAEQRQWVNIPYWWLHTIVCHIFSPKIEICFLILTPALGRFDIQGKYNFEHYLAQSRGSEWESHIGGCTTPITGHCPASSVHRAPVRNSQFTACVQCAPRSCT